MKEQAHLAVATAAGDTTDALAMAAECAAAGATLVEFRLDLMTDFNLARLLASSPLPAIVTCRPTYQGGQFSGSETERRAILQQAAGLGAPFIDVEAEALPLVAGQPRTRLIGSYHDFETMFADWEGLGRQIAAAGADIIKLVGWAANTDDVLPPLMWLAGLALPGIGIAMGACGAATRLLAPRFASCFLSFAAIDGGTAPGQIELSQMVELFGYHRLAGADPLIVMITPPAVPWELVWECRQALSADPSAGANSWLIPIPTPSLGPGLLRACWLARSDGILCLDEVARAPRLDPHDPDPGRPTWGRIPHSLAPILLPNLSI